MLLVITLAAALSTFGCNNASHAVSATPPGAAPTPGPNPNEAKWGPDTISRNVESGSEWKKLPNFLVMVGPGPSGLWVRLPKDARVRPMKALGANLPQGKTGADYTLPSEVALDSGTTIMVMLYQQEGSQGMDVEAMDLSSVPGGSRIIARPWVGLKMEADTGMNYLMQYPGLQLVVTAQCKGAAAKVRAAQVAEQIIASIRIDPDARPVDYFPGAGEEENRPIPPGTEIAMPDGKKIRAITSVGAIEIEAGPDSKRRYTWEGETRSVIMDARAKRWYGSLGLYYPGPGDHWKEHNGITRGVLEEGQQHFKTVGEAMKWIQDRSYMPFVYRNDGLMVGWGKVPERRQLNVEVWQIMIGGKKPTKLPGATDSAIVAISTN